MALLYAPCIVAYGGTDTTHDKVGLGVIVVDPERLIMLRRVCRRLINSFQIAMENMKQHDSFDIVGALKGTGMVLVGFTVSWFIIGPRAHYDREIIAWMFSGVNAMGVIVLYGQLEGLRKRLRKRGEEDK